MVLRFPYLANSDNRTKLAPRNSYCGDPSEWFQTRHFRERGWHFTTFDFFINWQDKTFQPIAWVKRIILADRTTDAGQIMASILECDGQDLYEDTKGFCDANGIKLQYILIPDIPVDNWCDPENKVILFDPNSFEVLQPSALELIELIRRYKVRSSGVTIGREGLRYSTSSLETFLSRSNPDIHYNGDAIYPGDADIVLFDAERRARIIIEVKKYNTGSQKSYGPLENETIALHLGDRLKYESLDILQRHFDCELYMLFYPVTQERIVKFEKIDRLKSRMSAVLPLPRVDSDDSLQEFQTRFFAFMCSVIGNSTSSGWKVFHTNYRCKYIPANAQKTSIFASRQEAMKAGYRICTACQRSNPWV